MLLFLINVGFWAVRRVWFPDHTGIEVIHGIDVCSHSGWFGIHADQSDPGDNLLMEKEKKRMTALLFISMIILLIVGVPIALCYADLRS